MNNNNNHHHHNSTCMFTIHYYYYFYYYYYCLILPGLFGSLLTYHLTFPDDYFRLLEYNICIVSLYRDWTVRLVLRYGHRSTMKHLTIPQAEIYPMYVSYHRHHMLGYICYDDDNVFIFVWCHSSFICNKTKDINKKK